MSIGGIGGYDPYEAYRSAGAYSSYGAYGSYASYGNADSAAGTKGSLSTIGNAGEDGESEAEIRAKKRAGIEECETCKNRQYQDGSDESDVSFKAPGHISPQASRATVAAHESQHVANAYQKASQNNGQVLQASVSYKMGVCPECGRSYVAGGETSTMIRYNNDTPYGNAQKSSDAANGALGANIDIAV